MNNNYVLRQLRYIFDWNDAQMLQLFEKHSYACSKENLLFWLKKEEEENFQEMPDKALAAFLNAFIEEKRGKKDGETPKAEEILNNNLILLKIKIALQLRDTDIMELFQLVDLRVGKHEISAFFRHPSQAQFRPCQDQFLRNFLFGLKKKFRANS